MSASSSACLVRFASWWIKCVLGCGEQGRITLLWLNAPLSHAWRPCTWPKLQPPTKPRAAQAAARRRFDWLLLPRCDGVRGMWLRFPAQGDGVSRVSAAALRALLQLLRSNVTPCKTWSVSNAAMRRRAGWSKLWTSSCRRRDNFQLHRKSLLPGQMSRRVEKPPACGRFTFGASVLHTASPQCGACSFKHRGLELTSNADFWLIAHTDWYLRALSVAHAGSYVQAVPRVKSNPPRCANL